MFNACNYDATFNLDAQDLSALENKLPRFAGEIPEDSFALVAYTASYYHKNKVWNLSLNIQWVVVLGTPN